jgi:hypothetical protein
MEYLTNLTISLMVGVIIGCLVVTLMDKMSLFSRLVLLIAVGCMVYILNEWVNVIITVIGVAVTVIWLALCKASKEVR